MCSAENQTNQSQVTTYTNGNNQLQNENGGNVIRKYKAEWEYNISYNQKFPYQTLLNTEILFAKHLYLLHVNVQVLQYFHQEFTSQNPMQLKESHMSLST